MGAMKQEWTNYLVETHQPTREELRQKEHESYEKAIKAHAQLVNDRARTANPSRR